VAQEAGRVSLDADGTEVVIEYPPEPAALEPTALKLAHGLDPAARKRKSAD